MPKESGNLEVDRAKEVRERQVIESTLQGERSGRASFAIRKSLIEDAIGEKMEIGKEFEIRYRIEGVGDFKTRHVEKGDDRIFISLPKEGRPENLRFGEKHRIEIYSIEERRDFNVMDTKEAGPTVKISRTSLESWGFREGRTGPNEKRILDLQFRNTSRPDSPAMRCFAADDGKREEMNLRVGSAGAKAGDVLRLEGRKEYRMDDFLRDFDKHKGEALKNARLLRGNEGLQMDVDGRNFVLREPRLDARGLRAVLSARIESTNRAIKFTFDGERVTGKLSDDTTIISLKSEHGLEVKYDQGGGAIRTFRLFDNFDAGVLAGRIGPIFSPEKEQGGQGDYIAESDNWLGEHVRARFSQIYGKERLAREKGDISEEIARCMLSMSGQWDEAVDHPFAIGGEGSRRRGPDSLQRLRSSGELHYFEFKWWSPEVEEFARFEAKRQAMRDLMNHPTYEGETVMGAYIGLLEWDVRTKEIRLQVERVLVEDD